jgi:hypothetical protein
MTGQVDFRLSELERRLSNIEERGSRRSALLEPRLQAVCRQVDELSEDVKSLRRALYTLAVGVVTASIVFALSVIAAVK